MGKKTIETIDCRIWSEPDERHRVKQIGMRKCGEVFEELKKHLESKVLMPDEYLLMSHRLSNETLPDFREAICHVNFGGNEGIYLDIMLSYQNELGKMEVMNFATGKTLGESVADFYRMAMIAGECSMMLNGNGCTLKNNAETVLILDSEESKIVKDSLLTQAVSNENTNCSNKTIHSILDQMGYDEQQNNFLEEAEDEMEV